MAGADHVYFLHDRTTGTIKIGASSDPESRMKSLQSQMPNDLVPIRYVKVQDGFEMERLLHEKFSQLRVRGEWFKATPELITFATSGDVETAIGSHLPTPVMPTPEKTFSMTHLAGLSNLPVRTLRYYISCGVLPPPFTRGRQSLYGQEHLDRLAQVREQQATGLTLAQIAAGFSQVQHHSVPSVWGQPTQVAVYSLAPDVEVTVRGDVPPSRKRHLLRAMGMMQKMITGEIPDDTSATFESDKET